MTPTDVPASQGLLSRYRILSYDFVISCSPELARQFAVLLAPFRRDARAPGEASREVDTYTVENGWPEDPRFAVVLRDRCIQRAESESGVIDYLIWKVNETATAMTDRFVAVHAAAASLGGAGILLPGPSGSGKTTLVAGLVRSGFYYLTDEVSLIDPSTATLHPFPRPLRMAPASIDAFPGLLGRVSPEVPKAGRNKNLVHADLLRPNSIGVPCDVQLVVFPHFATGSDVELQPLSRARALYLLADQAFNLSRFGRYGVQGLEAVVAESECFELTLGDLDQAVQIVRSLLHEIARVTNPSRHSR